MKNKIFLGVYLPGFLLLNLGQELLVSDGLIQLSSSGGGHLLQLLPNVVQLTQTLVDFGPTELGCVDQGLTGILDGLDIKTILNLNDGKNKCTVECRNQNVRNTNNAKSQMNASSVIRRSDFGHSGLSNQPKLVRTKKSR